MSGAGTSRQNKLSCVLGGWGFLLSQVRFIKLFLLVHAPQAKKFHGTATSHFAHGGYRYGPCGLYVASCRPEGSDAWRQAPVVQFASNYFKFNGGHNIKQNSKLTPFLKHSYLGVGLVYGPRAPVMWAIPVNSTPCTDPKYAKNFCRRRLYRSLERLKVLAKIFFIKYVVY